MELYKLRFGNALGFIFLLRLEFGYGNIAEYLISDTLPVSRESFLPSAELLLEGITAPGLARAVTGTIQGLPCSCV